MVDIYKGGIEYGRGLSLTNVDSMLTTQWMEKETEFGLVANEQIVDFLTM